MCRVFKEGAGNMILFHPEHVQPILDGIKIKTRRLGKKRWKVNSVHKAKTFMISQDYFALLRILTLHREPLGAMTEKDAWDEGGYTLSGYKDEWEKINGAGSWDPVVMVWVVQFERVFNLKEICEHCWQFNLPVACSSKKCCVVLLFDSPDRYATPGEIVEFCCRQRCHHTQEHHDNSCSIRLAGAGKEYLSLAKAIIKVLEIKDEHGFIIKRLTDYAFS